MPPNFVLLDCARPDIAILVAAMMQARDAVGRRSWAHPQKPTSDEWWADVLADPRARKRERRTDLAVKQASSRRMVQTTPCPTCSTILPHRVAAGSTPIGIGTACTTSSRSRARGNGGEEGVDTLLRLGRFCLDFAPSLFQGFHLSFRRGDDLLRERCEQRLKSPRIGKPEAPSRTSQTSVRQCSMRYVRDCASATTCRSCSISGGGLLG